MTDSDASSPSPNSPRLPEALRANGVDLGVSGGKALLGLIPSLGGFLAELLGSVVPEQRADRFARYLAKVEAALTDLDRRVTATDARQLGPEQIALFETGGAAAVKAYADSQLDRIARLVAEGLSADEVEAARTRRQIHLIAELSDDDIIDLCSRVEPYEDDGEWQEQHADVLLSYAHWKHLRDQGVSSEELRAQSLAVELRVSRLTALGLLENEPSLDMDELVDRLRMNRDGELTATRHREEGSEMRLYYGRIMITALGRSVLEHLGLWRLKPRKP